MYRCYAVFLWNNDKEKILYMFSTDMIHFLNIFNPFLVQFVDLNSQIES
jgi:hypothetical protein